MGLHFKDRSLEDMGTIRSLSVVHLVDICSWVHKYSGMDRDDRYVKKNSQARKRDERIKSEAGNCVKEKQGKSNDGFKSGFQMGKAGCNCLGNW